jgi:hypothetical protein
MFKPFPLKKGKKYKAVTIKESLSKDTQTSKMMFGSNW